MIKMKQENYAKKKEENEIYFIPGPFVRQTKYNVAGRQYKNKK